jgi:hypothetical protein
MAPISNVSAIVAPAGMVTVPLAHYAELIAARGELELLKGLLVRRGLELALTERAAD